MAKDRATSAAIDDVQELCGSHDLRNEVMEERTAEGGSEMRRSSCCFVTLL